MKLQPLGLTLTLCFLTAAAAEPLPAIKVGQIVRLSNFPSHFVAPRNVDVWLPPGYDGVSRCPVVYLHDGQMLFDASTTWNHESWHLDETVAALIRAGRIPAPILVGIWSTPRRHSEYFPEKALAFVPEPTRTSFVEHMLGGQPRGDDYLRFIVTELKPAIDGRFATLPDRAHTSIMGSSMGGIISLYALCEYPETFGQAACLSTHWSGIMTANATFPLAELSYLRRHLPDPRDHRIYFDHGTATLDSQYGEAQALADVLLHEMGYGRQNYLSLVFPGADHTEDAWAERAAEPLAFIVRR